MDLVQTLRFEEGANRRLLAFAVTGRTNEIGVRVALGANRGGILQLIVADVLKLVGMGVAIGVPVAWLSVRSAAALMFDAHASVGLPLLYAVVLLALSGTIAAAVPVVRAIFSIRVTPFDTTRPAWPAIQFQGNRGIALERQQPLRCEDSGAHDGAILRAKDGQV